MGALEGGQAPGDRVEPGGDGARGRGFHRAVRGIDRATRGSLLRALLCLDRVPVRQDLADAADRTVPEDVGVPADQLLRDRGRDVRDVEGPVVLGDPGREEDVHEDVAQLLADAGRGAATRVLDRVHGLGYLLEKVASHVGELLGPVPGAAARSAEAVDDLEEADQGVAFPMHSPDSTSGPLPAQNGRREMRRAAEIGARLSTPMHRIRHT